MKEEYLHYLWHYKKLPFHLLKTTENESISIKNFGVYNSNESGPDFFNAQMIINEIYWAGNIEFHIKSSDWYKHKHHHDPAYDNVILHVVYEHDQEVIIKDRTIPVIELKAFIHENGYKEFLSLSKVISDFPCKHEILNVDSIYLESAKNKAIINKLNKKTITFDSSINQPDQILYQLICRAFGNKVNNQPFFELAERIPIKIIKKEEVELTSDFILGTAGFELKTKHFFYLKRKYNIQSISKSQWKTKGLRPSSFPEIRLEQLINLIKKFDFDTNFIYFNEKENLQNFTLFLKQLNFSKDLIQNIMRNAIVPFIWWYGEVKQDEEIKDTAVSILELLPPEFNSIIKKWKEIGIEIKNSYDSQSLLELYNDICVNKGCLTCDVGHKIIYG